MSALLGLALDVQTCLDEQPHGLAGLVIDVYVGDLAQLLAIAVNDWNRSNCWESGGLMVVSSIRCCHPGTCPVADPGRLGPSRHKR